MPWGAIPRTERERGLGHACRGRRVSGDEPMTGAQASYLKTLSEQVHEDAFEPNLTKAEASKRIDRLKAKKDSAAKR